MIGHRVRWALAKKRDQRLAQDRLLKQDLEQVFAAFEDRCRAQIAAMVDRIETQRATTATSIVRTAGGNAFLPPDVYELTRR